MYLSSQNSLLPHILLLTCTIGFECQFSLRILMVLFSFKIAQSSSPIFSVDTHENVSVQVQFWIFWISLMRCSRTLFPNLLGHFTTDVFDRD